MTTKTPRPHTELIKEWADGAEIEYRENGKLPWRDASNPGWYENHEYRIKPAPKRKVEMWKWAIRTPDGVVIETVEYHSVTPLSIRGTTLCRIEGSRIEVEEE